MFLHYGDLTDGSRLVTLLERIAPHEVLAAGRMCVSFDEPEFTGDVTGMGTTRLLEAIRTADVADEVLSGVKFGRHSAAWRTRTPFTALVRRGRVYAYWLTHQLPGGVRPFAVNRILFRHESPRAPRPS